MIPGSECVRAVGLCLAACVFSADAAERIGWRDAGSDSPSVLVTGLTATERSRVAEAPEQYLRVHVRFAGVDAAALPALSGTCELTAEGLCFQPDYPLTPGLTYVAEFAGTGRRLHSRIALPKPAMKPRARVAAVYPSARVLPENLLKFYLHFSHPMSRGDVYRHISLLDDTEQPVELPFLEIGEELWNPEQTRLTLLIDPGRIKRGVKPLEDIGPALEAGRHYTLHIDRRWRDARGAELMAAHRHHFKVGSPDRTPPDPARWQLALPKVGTRQPLAVNFPEPLDEALATRVIWVEGPDGRVLDGEIALGNRETRWTLNPDRKWSAGRHRLKAATVLEDLAGNSIGRPFEVDQFERVGDGIKELPFTRVFEPAD